MVARANQDTRIKLTPRKTEILSTHTPFLYKQVTLNHCLPRVVEFVQVHTAGRLHLCPLATCLVGLYPFLAFVNG